MHSLLDPVRNSFRNWCFHYTQAQAGIFFLSIVISSQGNKALLIQFSLQTQNRELEVTRRCSVTSVYALHIRLWSHTCLVILVVTTLDARQAPRPPSKPLQHAHQRAKVSFGTFPSAGHSADMSCRTKQDFSSVTSPDDLQLVCHRLTAAAASREQTPRKAAPTEHPIWRLLAASIKLDFRPSSLAGSPVSLSQRMDMRLRSVYFRKSAALY